MRLPAILLASTAVTAQLSSIESGSSINEIQEENFEIEETEFEGDLEFDDAEDLEIDMILADIVRGRGGGKNSEKRMNKQKKKKGKQLLRLLKYAEPERSSRDWLEYGCYCFLNIKEDILTPGIGRPIDPLDSACHALQECLKCINIDHEQSKRCHPYNGYKFTSAPGDEYNDMICRDAENSCQRSTCECDREFIKLGS
ncbi:Oidioi.mRNA.OKI2018_I69.chr1.g2070.t1.cds [Oikopleura dioica]|uniref:Oidioi.mRNA.OKI2018_I69.chr1.g2070.t1.cds n=1 Tax=Oikopleura dioica TaxID=34765 RepID=A0ABN7SWV7_OIKDI|nr:Oidioi.mRNA.OKI2018_I69.chr1.g2070.t1.cds [Oikopleura dioica]